MKTFTETLNDKILPTGLLLASLAWVWAATGHVFSLVG